MALVGVDADAGEERLEPSLRMDVGEEAVDVALVQPADERRDEIVHVERPLVHHAATLSPRPVPPTMGRVRAFAISLAGAVAVAAGGCGSGEPAETPSACLAPASAYLTALESAPDAVALAGGTRISDCLVPEQEPGALARSAGRRRGGDAAQRGGARAARRRRGRRARLPRRRGPGGRGSTGGIHEDLKLRLDAAARFSPGGGAFPLSFERAFGTGYAAGQSSG